MKKYLMTGIAAVAMCAAFTSCSKDTEFEQITPEQTVQANYDAAFIKAFGQPAANQTWGFGTATRGITRGEYANANLWYKTYEVPANVTAKEKQLVTDYFTNNLFENQYRINNIDFTDFFVYQVYKGEEEYTAKNNGAPFVGSNQMNHLQTYVGGTMEQFEEKFQNGAGSGISWGNKMEEVGGVRREHMNDFNHGDNTENVYWDGYNDDAHKVIGAMLMVNSGTADFSYHNSTDNKYHNTYVIIPGEQIDPSLAGFWYVGFDFFANGGYVDGNGILQQSNMEVDRDWQFNDWIVRISPAELKYDGRIMAEDLSAEESGDFDFNDVVFDYRLNNDQTATVKLRAAGGTLELYVGGEANADKTAIIGGHEVHAEFGVGLSTMVNTGAGVGTKDPEPFSVACSGNDPINIKIWVKKGTTFMELTAHTGKPASKFQTKTTTKWCDEYISIINPYPNFATWVGDPNTDWTTPFYEKYADKDLTNNGDAIKGRM